jgi:hypothetical protein
MESSSGSGLIPSSFQSLGITGIHSFFMTTSLSLRSKSLLHFFFVTATAPVYCKRINFILHFERHNSIYAVQLQFRKKLFHRMHLLDTRTTYFFLCKCPFSFSFCVCN